MSLVKKLKITCDKKSVGSYKLMELKEGGFGIKEFQHFAQFHKMDDIMAKFSGVPINEFIWKFSTWNIAFEALQDLRNRALILRFSAKLTNVSTYENTKPIRQSSSLNPGILEATELIRKISSHVIRANNAQMIVDKELTKEIRWAVSGAACDILKNGPKTIKRLEALLGEFNNKEEHRVH